MDLIKLEIKANRLTLEEKYKRLVKLKYLLRFFVRAGDYTKIKVMWTNTLNKTRVKSKECSFSNFYKSFIKNIYYSDIICWRSIANYLTRSDTSEIDKVLSRFEMIKIEKELSKIYRHQLEITLGISN